MYTSFKNVYSTSNYKNTVNYKVYLGGTGNDSSSYTTNDYYNMERLLNNKGSVGSSAKSYYNSETVSVVNVGLIYPSDYGYSVLSSSCARTTNLEFYSSANCAGQSWLYGKGYDRSNLYHCLRFYKAFPGIVDTVCRQSNIRLSWSHYRTLLQVHDEVARKWYEKEAYEQTWSVRTLQRNIDTQYYYRLLQSGEKESVMQEMLEKNYNYQQDKFEFIKNPVVVEFLGLTPDASFNETDLETSIISNLQKFLMELGKGYAFVARQQHIHTEKQDYFIDLVFYNYILKCFVLIDLKTSRITHQDVGQMDMYIRMYDELKKSADDNPTLGIVLCSQTDEDIARYSILHGNEQLFASKYKLYLPTEEELREEIETQKAMFYLQQKEAEEGEETK